MANAPAKNLVQLGIGGWQVPRAGVQVCRERSTNILTVTDIVERGIDAAANFALETMGKKTGAFEATLADDYSVFTAANLAQYDLILFNSTTRLKFPNPEHRKAIMDFLAAGKGVAGIHAASDNFDNWPEALAMMGGIFSGHPWTAGGTSLWPAVLLHLLLTALLVRAAVRDT